METKKKKEKEKENEQTCHGERARKKKWASVSYAYSRIRRQYDRRVRVGETLDSRTSRASSRVQSRNASNEGGDRGPRARLACMSSRAR
jgi:hypothetical protein